VKTASPISFQSLRFGARRPVLFVGQSCLSASLVCRPVLFVGVSSFCRSAGYAANSINDWYPEKVNQAFSCNAQSRASVAELLFAGIGNRGCLPTRQIIKAMVDHCNPGTVLLRSFLLQVR
jgi:uncharacterized membrane protein